MRFHKLITGLLVGQILSIGLLLLLQLELMASFFAETGLEMISWSLGLAMATAIVVLLVVQQSWKELDRSLFSIQILLLFIVSVSIWFSNAAFSVAVLFGAIVLSLVALNGYRSIYHKKIRRAALEIEQHATPVVASQHASHIHDPHCMVVERIPKKDRKMFSNSTDALQEGYTPCRVCNVA